jgi:hypothetical protein
MITFGLIANRSGDACGEAAIISPAISMLRINRDAGVATTG